MVLFLAKLRKVDVSPNFEARKERMLNFERSTNYS
jgi:hypothetical protein